MGGGGGCGVRVLPCLMQGYDYSRVTVTVRLPYRYMYEASFMFIRNLKNAPYNGGHSWKTVRQVCTVHTCRMLLHVSLRYPDPRKFRRGVCVIGWGGSLPYVLGMQVYFQLV